MLAVVVTLCDCSGDYGACGTLWDHIQHHFVVRKPCIWCIVMLNNLDFQDQASFYVAVFIEIVYAFFIIHCLMSNDL